MQPSLFIYLDSEGRAMVRPYSNWRSHPDQPCMVAYRLLLHLVWGPPPEGRPLACHVACDHHRCMNATHGRHGSHADNYHEWRLLRELYDALEELSPQEREAYLALHHPCRALLAGQGFECYTT